MRKLIACTQCNGLMALEDRGELLDPIDVVALFGYRCLNCGHVEPTAVGFPISERHVLAEDGLEVQHAR